VENFEIEHITALIEKSKDYRKSKILDKAESEGMLVYLVEGRNDKLKQDVLSERDMSKENCPYCNEAIPCKHMGEISDWIITGNKFAGTDIEVSAVSKKHETCLNTFDYRTWMHIAENTDSSLLYSPARKSLPSHKHVQLFNYPESSLFSASKKWIRENVGVLDEYKYKALVVGGNFEDRFEKTAVIIKRLYSREHMFNIVISPRETYIMPSKVHGKMLGNRVFFGIASTEDKGFFDYIKKPADKRDDSYKIPNYSDCDYNETELLELINDISYAVPDMEDFKKKADSLGAKIRGILALGEESMCSAHSMSRAVGADLKMLDFTFITDKKGNFYSSCVVPHIDGIEGNDLLVVSNYLSKNIISFLKNLAEKCEVNKLFTLTKNDQGVFELNNMNLETGWEEAEVTPKMLIKSTNLDRQSGGNAFLIENINKVKKICKEDGLFVEMVILMNVNETDGLYDVISNFEAATFVNLNVDSKDNREKNELAIEENIQPFLRNYELITHSKKELPNTGPMYKKEEGIILIYSDTPAGTCVGEKFEDFINFLQKNCGRVVFVISDRKFI